MTRVTKRKGRTDHSIKGRQLQVCVALPPEYVKRIRELARENHESVAHYFREALRLLFEEHDEGKGSKE